MNHHISSETKLQCVDVNFFVEVPDMHAKQQTAFSAAAIIKMFYVCNVFRLYVCGLHKQSKSPWADMMEGACDFPT
jgi:hypothetical protein